MLPNQLVANTPEKFSIGLRQKGKPVKAAEYVFFEISKGDGSVKPIEEKAKVEGNGTYSITKTFPQEGLYYLKVHASSDGSIIMPTKKFIVGKLSDDDRKKVSDQINKKEFHDEHHH